MQTEQLTNKFVKHVSELLRAKNPGLGQINKARLSFAQKVSLVGSASKLIDELLPGVRQLNKIRNRVAHSLHMEITTKGTNVLLSSGIFRAMRNESAKKDSRKVSTEPIDIVDDFTMHFGRMAQSQVSQIDYLCKMYGDGTSSGTLHLSKKTSVLRRPVEIAPLVPLGLNSSEAVNGKKSPYSGDG